MPGPPDPEEESDPASLPEALGDPPAAEPELPAPLPPEQPGPSWAAPHPGGAKLADTEATSPEESPPEGRWRPPATSRPSPERQRQRRRSTLTAARRSARLSNRCQGRWGSAAPTTSDED